MTTVKDTSAPDLAGIGEDMAKAALKFIRAVCDDEDWEDAGNRLNDLVLAFRRAARAKSGGDEGIDDEMSDAGEDERLTGQDRIEAGWDHARAMRESV